MKQVLTKTKLIILLILMSFISIIFSCNDIVFASPNDSIITNNDLINHQQTLLQLTDAITSDNLNYIFKKEEINENLSLFKVEFISTLNNYISSNNYIEANDYLNKYLHLFNDDIQVLSFKEYISSELTKSNLIEYTGDIEVLSFYPLIAYPRQVLVDKNSSSKKLDENHVTTDEFNKILLNLYEKNYVLTSPKILTTSANGSIEKQKLMLPKNKKPLILILEDVEYNSRTNGCVDKLLIDRNDQLSTYTPKRAVNDRIHTDNDFVTILENFVETHPSFSHNGAKALIVVDGSRGIFGYSTQKTNATSKYEIKKAIKVINYLKNNGYSFASKGYGTSINDSVVSFASGLNTWQNDIVPLVGDSNIFFLNSSYVNLPEDISEQSKLLSSFNYNVFIGLEMENKFEHISALNGLYLSAKPVNGKTLRYSQSAFSHLFDCEKIYDHVNRSITFNS